MKISVKSDDLFKIVNFIKMIYKPPFNDPHSVPKIALKVVEDVLEITLFDRDVQLKMKVPCVKYTGGNCWIKAQYFTDILSNCTSTDDFFIATQGSSIVFRTGNVEFKVEAFLGESRTLPIPTSKKYTQCFEVSYKDLYHILNFTLPKRLPPNTKEYHRCVYMDYSINKLIFVSTNGHVLNKACLRYEHPSGIFIKPIVIPMYALALLKNVLQEDHGLITVKAGEDSIEFENDFIKISVISLNVQYPNYAAVIPQATKTEVKINRLDFLTALQNISPVSSEHEKLVALDISGEKLEAKIQNHSTRISASFVVPCASSSHIKIGFNIYYLLEILLKLQSTEIHIEFSNVMEPVLFLDLDHYENLIVAMPMRIT